jgi:hypothetical protein
MPCAEPRGGNETARVHHARWRRGGVAVGGARAAGQAHAPHGRAYALRGERSGSASLHRALLQGLQHLGWSVGNNIEIDYRWSAGNEDHTRKYAAELVVVAPDVISAYGSAAVGPLQRATRMPHKDAPSRENSDEHRQELRRLAECGYACHTNVKATDYIFTAYLRR